ncbi:MAG TPA: hypothetical protein VME86_06170 [Acidobacteriaceae bacterium]|nr:hypothetical protein [Acidobacteriaceae bacterium]
MTRPATRFDSDANKGAAEIGTPQSFSPDHPTRPDLHGNLSSQLPHRNAAGHLRDFIDDSDTDFPEPGSNPEHSGQR